tara:strand:+ start:629 stop:2278 length:1650 start_codon:yes stop_codon:yes gene_type:complete
MSKKKVLFCSEASWLSTGYSVYTKEVLSRLKDVEDIEVAELACYAAIEDVEGRDIPWQVYPNKPSPNDPALNSYNGNPSAQFGEQAFNQVLLHYQPDIVIDIRDWWMIEYQQRSPFRDFFHWAIMPTVDATPQADQWINTYASADAVFAYSEFGRDTLLNQCRDIKFVDTASPSASNAFMPYGDKGEHKASMGLSENVLILGTVMRNQKRKLYPDLFESFRRFLDEVKDPNIYLLCHTYYPDVGWEIPKFINEFGLSSRVLFTYKCKNCGQISVNFFQDSVQHCRHCNEFACQMVGINNSISENELASVYNLFDIYVQYANSEGFGMPQLEAAQCSVPVISTYYSAMQSIVDNIDAIGIQPLSYYIECETGCKRAIPDNNKFVEELVKLYHSRDQLPSLGAEMRNNALDYYNWDKTAEAWLKHIMKVKPKDPQETWLSPPQILQPATTIPPEINSIVDKVNYLFHNTLHKPEWIGGYLWKKVLKDCTFGYRCENVHKDFYFNESHVQAQQGNQAFSIDDAIKELAFFREQINEWEKARYEKVSSMGGRQ